MKHVVLLLFISLNASLFAQWVEMITPAIYHHYAIDAVTDDLVYAGGYGGSFVKTTDGGENWEDVGIGMSHWVNSIHFFDEDYGWITCQSGGTDTSHVLKTIDGGETWTSMHHDDNYSCMYWLDESTVYVGAWSGKIYFSEDTGETWTVMNTPADANITNVQFFDNLNGVALNTSDEFYITNDGGETWNTFFHYGMYSFQFIDQNIGYCASSGGRIGKTIDGGETFTYYETPFPDYKLFAVHFMDEYHGYVVGGLDCSDGVCTPKPAILSTTDGGETWLNHIDHPYLSESIGFYDITVTPSGIPFLAGSDQVILKNEVFASVDNFDSEGFTFYPNPSKGIVNASLPAQDLTVVVTSVTGNIVLEVQTNRKTNLQLDLLNQEAGMYFVQLLNANAELIGYQKLTIN